MKFYYRTAASLAIASCLALTAAAQTPSAQASSTERVSRPGNQAPLPLKASALIGADVMNGERKKIGSVADLAIDLESGRIRQVIVSSGGLLSMGERTVAIPASSLRFDANAKTATLDLTDAELKNAPQIDLSQWKEFYRSDRAQAADDVSTDGSRNSRMNTDGSKPSAQPGAMNKSTAQKTGATIQADKHAASDSHALRSHGAVLRASEILELSVVNAEEDAVGSVEDMIVDLRSGRVVAVIVSTGGFLGVGDALNAIPPAAFATGADDDSLRINLSKEALTRAPRFKAGEWPDFSHRDTTEGMNRAFPAWSRTERDLGQRTDGANSDRRNDLTADADNAARNKRDRDDRTLTAGDQGDSETDIEITRQIRRAIVAHDDLSINARNVKIITVNGRVTLRGPVGSAAERKIIGDIATRIAAPKGIDNQLEVTAR